MDIYAWMRHTSGNYRNMFRPSNCPFTHPSRKVNSPSQQTRTIHTFSTDLANLEFPFHHVGWDKVAMIIIQFFLKLCCRIIIFKIPVISVSVIPAEVVFNLYSTLIILLEQQSSSHCHDVKALPFYIRGDYTSEMRKRIDQLKETPTQILPQEFCTMWAGVIFDIGRLW